MTNTFMKVTEEELTAINGGQDVQFGFDGGPWRVVMNPTTGFVILRSAPVSDRSNELGELYNDDIVQLLGNGPELGSDGQSYLYVYTPKLHMNGYVNASFIQ